VTAKFPESAGGGEGGVKLVVLVTKSIPKLDPGVPSCAPTVAPPPVMESRSKTTLPKPPIIDTDLIAKFTSVAVFVRVQKLIAVVSGLPGLFADPVSPVCAKVQVPVPPAEFEADPQFVPQPGAKKPSLLVPLLKVTVTFKPTIVAPVALNPVMPQTRNGVPVESAPIVAVLALAEPAMHTNIAPTAAKY